VKCLLDVRDRRVMSVCEGMGWPVSYRGDSAEVDLPDTWAAELAALMALIGEGVRRKAEGA